MKNRSRLFALLLTLTVGTGSAFAQGTAIKTVYVKGNEIFTISANGQPRQLTFDGIRKGNPLWSKDGTKISFERKIDRGIALDNVIVIDPEAGQTLANLLICPTSPEEEYDVTYIERIEWLSSDKIAASGSINPSTEHTYVYDTKTGKEIADYTDDDGGTIFSPDGEHAASLDSSPHWTKEGDRHPELSIDYQPVYPASGVHVRLLSKPAWSADSGKIAVVAENYESKQRSVVVCGLHGNCESTALSTVKPDPDDRFKVQWKDGRVFVTFPEEIWSWTTQETAWSLDPGDKQAVLSAMPPDLKSITDGMTSSLQKQIKKSGGVEPDFWCNNCALAKLRRQAPKW